MTSKKCDEYRRVMMTHADMVLPGHIPDNMILLKFGDKETVDHIRNVLRKKGYDLESYILDNFEWDDMPVCLNDETMGITAETCDGCDYYHNCPDCIKGVA